MTFTIETGVFDSPAPNAFQIDRVQSLLEMVDDALPDDAPQSARDSLIIQAITGELRKPKTMETVRRTLIRYWPLIVPLAEREPDQFDAILLEFAERTNDAP